MMDEEDVREDARPHPDIATVSQKKKQRPLGLFLILVIAIGVVSFAVLHSSAPQKNLSVENPREGLQNSVTDDTLKENLAKLKQQVAMTQANVDAMKIELPDKEMDLPASNNERRDSNVEQKEQELALRRTMPSSMYSETPIEQMSVKKKNAAEATFAGKDSMSELGNKSSQTTVVEASNIPHPDYTVAEGEILHGVLETPINSDLPGMVRAVINQPIYAYVSDKPLIPVGARLIGQYASMVKGGQTRAFVVWSRVILPDGISIAVNSPGADQLGQTGLPADKVDHHFFERFGNATLLSIIGAGAANVGVTANDQYNSAASYRQAISQSFQQSANDALQDSSDISNTLIIHQGQQVTVFVAHDLSFYQVLKKGEEL
jgi:type IV secretion system protein VirB10